MTQPETQAVLKALSPAGQELRFVGGCVRDAILGRPVNDLDIATADLPDEVIQLLVRAEIKAVPTGLAHGTVTALVNHIPFEITTLRRDVETDGRRATVAFTQDWREDAARRDLTINALSCRPDGEIFDYFGGLDDLRAGRVRFVGSAAQRIAEDYLRILRFFRFQARYGRDAADAQALQAVTQAAPKLSRLSGERVRSELLRLLEVADPLPTLAVMRDREILATVLPEATDLATLKSVLDLQPDAPAFLRLAAWLTGDAAAAQAIAERLRLSNSQARLLATYLSPPLPAALTAQARLDAKALKLSFYRQGRQRGLELLLLQLGRQALASPDRRAAVWREAQALAAAWTDPNFPVRGADLLACGLENGPEVGRALRKLENWWIEQDYQPDRQACLRALAQL